MLKDTKKLDTFLFVLYSDIGRDEKNISHYNAVAKEIAGTDEGADFLFNYLLSHKMIKITDSSVELTDRGFSFFLWGGFRQEKTNQEFIDKREAVEIKKIQLENISLSRGNALIAGTFLFSMLIAFSTAGRLIYDIHKDQMQETKKIQMNKIEPKTKNQTPVHLIDTTNH